MLRFISDLDLDQLLWTAFWCMVVVLVVSYCAPAHASPDEGRLQDIHNDLLSLYVQEYQPPDEEKVRYHSGREVFRGDCDDFYTAAGARLRDAGYEHVMVDGYDKRTHHIMACVRGVACLDPLRMEVLPWSKARQEYRRFRVNEPPSRLQLHP